MDSDRLLLWIVFNVFVLGMLALDLGVFHRKAHAVSLREALTWSVVWISLALVFNAWIYYLWGSEKALEFLTGYLIEKSLSVDNIFVFLVIFSYFSVPAMYQHRVLFWGILGALIMRAIFIATGAALLTKFHWMIYVFGGFLVFTGLKLLFAGDEKLEPEKNPAVRLARRYLNITKEYCGQNFFVRQKGKLWATPLLLVLLVVETTDVIFAVDSIPAIFAITLDPFIVYTSNVFAILGLRALYFLLAGVMDMFRFLKVGLSFVLCFVGVKMTLVDVFKIPIGISLGAVAMILLVSIVASLLVRPKEAAKVSTPGVLSANGRNPTGEKADDRDKEGSTPRNRGVARSGRGGAEAGAGNLPRRAIRRSHSRSQKGQGSGKKGRVMSKNSITGLPLFKKGKVRDVYILGDRLLMVATDRISAFDVVLPTEIPDKGKILTALSTYWFRAMEDIVHHHLLTTQVDQFPSICQRYKDKLEGRSMLVKKTSPAPVECIVRGYISGSAWKEYRERGEVCGIPLPQGLKEASRLEEPIFTPSTKAPVGEHDENITFAQMVQRIGKKKAESMRDISLAIYRRARDMAEAKGIIIADTKLEFGLENGEVILIDEVLTPDSSRFWPAEGYQPGKTPDSFDKQYVRDYLLSLSWDMKAPAPALPPEVVRKTQEKYSEALRRLTT